LDGGWEGFEEEGGGGEGCVAILVGAFGFLVLLDFVDEDGVEAVLAEGVGAA
jgi:hypothetical protein